MDLIKEIVIKDPPTKYIDRKKTKIDPETGKLKETIYYLTANLFYGGIQYYLRYKITKAIKNYLVPYFKNLPRLSKLRVEITYFKPQDHFDLDNKVYFWVKMILDILKTPTSKQILNANKKGHSIITVNVLKDDTVRYIDEICMRYEKGEHKIVVKLYGVLEIEQKQLF